MPLQASVYGIFSGSGASRSHGCAAWRHSRSCAKILAKKYFDDKGFKNADIQINQRDDVANKGQVILDVIVDKKEKIKVHEITIDGNEQLSDTSCLVKIICLLYSSYVLFFVYQYFVR